MRERAGAIGLASPRWAHHQAGGLLTHDGYGHLSRRDPSTCVVQATGSYLPVFFIAAFAYLAGLAIIHALVPRLEPARIES